MRIGKLFPPEFVDAMFRFYADGEFDDSNVLPTETARYFPASILNVCNKRNQIRSLRRSSRRFSTSETRLH